ncbi:hypothetical protein DDE05_40400 [Streptomyces cavourensis]|nr:hypothetical protein DDE05_40400 [Streptomyces cavourensis]
MSLLKRERRSTLAAHLQWGVYLAGRRLGKNGLAAAALLAGLLAIDGLYLQPRIDGLETDRDSGLLMLERLPQPRMHHGKPRMSLRDVQKLRGSEQAYAALRILKQHDLARMQATYRYQAEAKGRLGRLSVDIGVKGVYADLRSAMREIADLPMARIERFTAERQDIGSAMVEASLRISFLGAES